MQLRRSKLLAGLVLAALGAGGLALLRSSAPPAAGISVGLALLVLSAIAARSCFRAIERAVGAERIVWLFFLLGAALTSVAQIIFLQAQWRGIDLTAATPVGYASWAILHYAVFVGFYLAAFLKPHRHSARGIRPAAVVDTLLLALLLLSLYFYVAAASHLSSGHPHGSAAALSLVSLLGLGAAAGLVSCRRQAQTARWKGIYAHLAAAVVCQTASQAIAIRMLRSSAPADFLEAAAFALLALAPLRPAEAPAPRAAATAEAPVVSVWRELWIPCVVLLGLLGVPLLDSSFAASADSLRLRNTTLVVVMGVYVLLVLGRQFLVQMENRDLAFDLQRESLRLRLLLSNIQDAVITEDLDGRIVFANDRFLEMFGLSRPQIHNLRLEDCIHPEDRRLRWSSDDPFIENSLGPSRFEFRGLRKDGTVLYLESSTAPVRPGGMILGYQSVIRDITERREAEERQRALAQRLEFLVSHTPLGCIVFDPDCRIVEWNESASRIFGWSANEAFGRNALELLVAPDLRPALVDWWNELVGSKSSDHRFNQNVTKDRGIIECEWFNTSLIDETGHVVAVASMAQDITERKNLEAQLRQSQKMEAVGVLAGGVAHDFNNLLTVMVGNISLALMRLGGDHPSVRGLRDAEKAGERAAELVRQLLGFGRKSPTSLRAISVSACVRETIELLRPAVDPRIMIEVREQPDLWLVDADPGQIHQVLMNLCVNAKDAMENGGRLVIATANRVIDAAYCRLRPEARSGGFVELSVSDTGTGMDRATLARIFEPFFTTKQLGKGTGLGLAMVYGIVKQHEGWVTVESEPGKGARFSAFLPRSLAPAEKEVPDTAGAAARGSETILLVDDEDMIRNLARSILETLGHRVLEARDGDEALEVFQRNLDEPGGRRIDLVLLDVMMPRKSGRDTLVELQRLAPHVPVVMASGYATDAPGDLTALGARTFIQKPYHPADLTRAIRSILDSPAPASVPR